MILDLLKKRKSIRNFTEKDVSDKVISYILEAWRLSPCGGNDCQRTSYSLLKFLVDKGTVIIKEWESQSSLMALNYEPFYNIVTIDNEVIVVDKEKLLSLVPENMYEMKTAFNLPFKVSEFI